MTIYTWNGGASGNWADVGNWLVNSSVPSVAPSTTDHRVDFPADLSTEVDLGGASITCEHMRIGERSQVTIKNGSLSMALPLYTEQTWRTISPYATLRFSAANVTCRANNHFALMYGTCARLEVVNHSTFATPAGLAWLPNAAGGGVLVSDSTVNIGSEFYFCYNYNWAGGRTTGPNGEKIAESFIASNSTITVGQNVRPNYTGYLELYESTMTVGNEVRFEYLKADGGQHNFGYPSPVFKFIGTNAVAMLSAKMINYTLGYESDSGETWDFEVMRTQSDSPVIQIGSNGWAVPNDSRYEGTKIIVTAPAGWNQKYGASLSVPLIRSVGSISSPIPTCIATKDSDNVTLSSEVVGYEWVGNDGVGNSGGLDVQYGIPDDPSPYLALISEPKLLDSSSAKASIAVSSLGQGATSYDISMKAYSDNGYQTLVSSSSVVSGGTTKSNYDVVITNLTIGARYYAVAEIVNDIEKTNTLEIVFDFTVPEYGGDDYTWVGAGDGQSWTDPFNWGVRNGYPSNSTQTATFAEATSAVVELGAEPIAVGTIYIGRAADIVISNGNLIVGEILQRANSLGESGNNRLEFSHVSVSRIDAAPYATFFVYGTQYPTSGNAIDISQRCQLVFNNTTFSTSALILPASRYGRFVASNSTICCHSFLPAEWHTASSQDTSVIFVNSRLIGGNTTTSRYRSSAGSGDLSVETRFENTEITGFSNLSNDSGSNQFRSYGRGQEWIGSSHMTVKTVSNPLYMHDYYQNSTDVGIVFRATTNGFPRITDEGAGGIIFDIKKNLVINLDANVKRPPGGVWVMAESENGTITYPAKWTSGTNTLSDCSSFCTYTGIANPGMFNLVVTGHRLALTFPGQRGLLIMVQ